jgi:transitional endoplasmic reticulum ATPase
MFDEEGESMKRNNVRALRPGWDYEHQTKEDPMIAQAYRVTVQVWMLRILCRLDGYRQVGDFLNIDPEDVAAAVDLELEPGEPAKEGVNRVSLSRQLQKFESQVLPEPCALTRNLDFLQDALSLDRIDRDILELALMFRKNNKLVRVAELLGDSLTLGDAVGAIAVILAYPREDVQSSLGREGKLRMSGLVHVDRSTTALGDKVLVLAHLLDAVSVPNDDAEGILSTFLDAAPPPRLAAGDFDDYAADYALLREHLAAAITKRRIGCNILIHGEPGVGKTQLVRTLVKDIGAKLFEIVPEDAHGESMSATERLSMLLLTQRFLAKASGNVVLIDEVEDVFPNHGLSWLFGRGDANQRKGWINDQLERNPVPVFWLANTVSQIDPAHLRRFDIVVELRPMSTRARARVLRAACRRQGLKGGKWIEQAARNRGLSPALIDKVTSAVASTLAPGREDEAAAFERVANGVLKAMDYPPLKLNTAPPLLPYCRDVIAADVDIDGLVAGLGRTGSGRLLCYGPPGTGKTAFANHLAQELKLPLLQFRASDILGPYVGMTERNIADAFRQAREQGAIMLLDEIDSLLRSREGASRSWEVTQVNELLVQMEDHPGILIACTNFRDGLDAAAARRFDAKIGFDYLSADAAWTFFRKVLRHHKVALGRRGTALKARIARLRYLTPGDFRAAVRKCQLTADGLTPSGLVQALEGEVAVKPVAASRGIGFTSGF